MRAGQALIVVLLVVGVALTVGLAIVARSVTEVSVSTVQDESARALSAAEAGIEQSLGGVITGSGAGSVGTVGDAFTVQSNSSSGITSYVYPEELVAGDTATMAVDAGFLGGGKTIRLCWGGNGAIEVMGYYLSGSTILVNTKAYDSSSRGNGFDLGTSDVSSCPAANSPFNNSAIGGEKTLTSNSFVEVLISNSTGTFIPLKFLVASFTFSITLFMLTPAGPSC